ncbi:MAG: sterol desaturase family protein [Geminicoccaceae bacterium]
MEAAIRLGIFLGIFAVVALLEVRFPRRPRQQTRLERWRTNLGILVVDVVAQRLTVGAAAYVTAVYAQAHGWGLFNLLGWPWWVEAVLAFLILDFAIYLQHVMSHALPAFWRLHRVHHSDLEVDLTTGIRFHPVEIVISMVYKAAVVAAIGADPWVVVAFEVVLNASAVFTHGNVRLPDSLDRALRLLVCTPDMHRVHHSVVPVETNSNFGFFLSVWDRLCGTMRHAPAAGQVGATLGLGELRDPRALGLLGLLRLPLDRPHDGTSFLGPDREPAGSEPALGRRQAG